MRILRTWVHGIEVTHNRRRTRATFSIAALQLSTPDDAAILHVAPFVSRYGFKCREVAARINKHHTSITRLLNQGLQAERDDLAFRNRIGGLDTSVSNPD